MSNKTKRKGQTAVAPKPYQAQGKQKQASNGQGAQARAQTQTQPRPQSQAPVQTKPQPKVVDPVEQEAKRTARMEKQAAQRAAAERRKRTRMIRRYGIIGAIVVVLIGTFVALYINEASKPGESIPAMANRQHLDPGQLSGIQYNSEPPTNGPHSEAVPSFKIYTEPITNELALHGLEDGGVIINYQPELDQPTVDKLAAIATSYLEIGGGRSHVIMYPYPGLSNPVVLRAWRRLDRLSEFDEPRIRKFIDAYVGIDHHESSEGRRIP